ncbi:PIN domain-containing protein [Halorussus amylolyticus]|uniref:PIN domain-containing protein n=1 Tax=Halorussus amylolyticus TaxID=1126242 RepID=UPI00138EDC84|nr:PIN domain-containing protein [Halorussus amylolyticus]
MKCLDSSFLADYTRGRASAIRYLEERGDEDLGVPTIALYELFAGRLAVESDVTLDDFDRAFDWTTEIGFTDAYALEAARVRQELMDSGQRIQHPDMLLAGVARSLNATVVASDRDFERVENLCVENHRKMFSK